jgi:hypothetical protein
MISMTIGRLRNLRQFFMNFFSSTQDEPEDSVFNVGATHGWVLPPPWIRLYRLHMGNNNDTIFRWVTIAFWEGTITQSRRSTKH